MEIWDILDREGKPTGKTVSRKKAMKGQGFLPEEYHLSVEVFIVNSRGEMLFTRRSPEKTTFGGYWETTAGSAIEGEESGEAILREIKEEIGIRAAKKELIFKRRIVEEIRSQLMDLYFLKKDIPLEDIVFQEGETCDAKWVPIEWSILDDESIVPQMRERMRFVWFDLLRFTDSIEIV